MADSSNNGSIEGENRRKVVGFFLSGAKAQGECRHLGVEVEHYVMSDDGRAVSYDPHDGLPGVAGILEALSGYYPERSYGEGGQLIGLSGDEGSVTLEPAAQLELSAAPYTRVAQVEAAFSHFYRRVGDYLAPLGCHLEEHGYHPARKALELPLIPKRRYGFMNDYFAHIGSHGERMMRGSASTQVSVDYSSEEDAVRKMRVAEALSPVLAAIMDNTPVFEGAPNPVPIRRLQLWREVDGLRCGVPEGLFEDGFGFGAYADWLLSTPPIFVDRPAAAAPDGPALRAFFDEPASAAYADAPMSKADVEHLVSMFWPDVRLKRFVEIRPADSVALPQVLGYTALVKGIFYSPASLSAVEDAAGVEGGRWPIGPADVDAAIRSVQEHGFSGSVYGTPLREWERLVFGCARASLDAEEAAYLDALEEFAGDKPWKALS